MLFMTAAGTAFTSIYLLEHMIVNSGKFSQYFRKLNFILYNA